MLLRERLGRRHQCALPRALDRAQQCVERDHRLPGTDIALKQALHRRRAREVEVDLRDRALLVLGQLEREHVAIATDQRARLRQCPRDGVLVAGACDDELQREELVESEPTTRGLGLGLVAREMDRRDRITRERFVELCGQCVRQVAADGRERDADEIAQLRRRHLLARGIHRCEVGGRQRLADVEALDVEAVTAELTPQPQVRSRRQLVCEPGLVEPRGADHAARILDARRDDRAPAAEPACAHVLHDARDRDFLVAPELRDRDLVDGELVAPGPVLEQIEHRLDPERAEALCQRSTDTGKRVDAHRCDAFRRPPSRAVAATRAGPHL